MDGLRALAALAVALFHFRGYVLPLAAALPHALDVALKNGFLGVHVFFVLSGFVISHSLRNASYSLPFTLRFALRRQLRLDPPYWFTLALAAASLARTPDLPFIRLAPKTLLAHVVYLQNILGYPNVIDVFWTLCIEVQLYLAFVLLAWLGQSLTRRLRDANEWLLVITTLASLSLCFFTLYERIGAWFVWYWYMFALGIWARLALQSRRARYWLLLFSLLAIGRAVRFHGPGPAVCVATAALLFLAPRSNAIAKALSVRPLLYLGTLSYSFYLVHILAGGAALTTILAGGPPSLLRCSIALIAALAASVLAAHALHFAIERPAMNWSRKVPLEPANPHSAATPRSTRALPPRAANG